MSLRPIKDIRFFEAVSPLQPGGAHTDHLGTLFPLANPSRLAADGTRYALALAGAGFQTRRYDHVYVLLTPAMAQGEIEISPMVLESWMVIVNVGMPREGWPVGDEHAQFELLIRAATRSLELLCQRDELDGSTIPTVERSVLDQGDALEIVRLRKETKSYRVTVSYRIKPFGTKSPVFLEYVDHVGGRQGKIELLQVADFEDVFALFASTAITEGVIVLSPRSSAAAKLITRRYKAPFRVPVERVLRGMSGC